MAANFTRAGDFKLAIEAARTGKAFFPNQRGGKSVLVLGLDRLEEGIAARLLMQMTEPKTKANFALLYLDGVQADLRLNHAGTCWVVDLTRRLAPLIGWESHHSAEGKSLCSIRTKLAGPSLPASNNPLGPHHVGLISGEMPFDKAANPATMKFLKEAVEFQRRVGKTPRQAHAEIYG